MNLSAQELNGRPAWMYKITMRLADFFFDCANFLLNVHVQLESPIKDTERGQTWTTSLQG